MGGALADGLGLPLAWLIGPLLVSAGFALVGVQATCTRLRAGGLVVLGLALGQSFTPQILAQVAMSLPVIVLCSLVTLGLGLPMMRLFTRHARLSPDTAFFAAVPGGVVLMAIQASRVGASEQHVVLAQSLRLVVVVLIYPALIVWLVPHHGDSGAAQAALSQPLGWPDLPALAAFVVAGFAIALAMRRTFLPNPWMIAPCLLAIAVTAIDLPVAGLPHGLITLCQIILGVSLGARMTRGFLFGSGRLALVSVASSLLLTLLLVPVALLVAHFMGYEPGAVLLGMSPGGMPEMTVAARAIGTDVPLVLSFHLTRILIGNLLLEPFWRWAGGRHRKARDVPAAVAKERTVKRSTTKDTEQYDI